MCCRKTTQLHRRHFVIATNANEDSPPAHDSNVTGRDMGAPRSPPSPKPLCTGLYSIGVPVLYVIVRYQVRLGMSIPIRKRCITYYDTTTEYLSLPKIAEMVAVQRSKMPFSFPTFAAVNVTLRSTRTADHETGCVIGHLGPDPVW